MGSSGAGQTLGSTRAGGQEDDSYTQTPSNKTSTSVGSRRPPPLYMGWGGGKYSEGHCELKDSDKGELSRAKRAKRAKGERFAFAFAFAHM